MVEGKRQNVSELDWGTPVPIGEDAPIPFPTHILPPTLHNLCAQIAASTQTPYDMAAMLSLAAISAAAKGRFEVEVRPDYVEAAVLQVIIGAKSGERKSALKFLGQPHREWENAVRAERTQNIRIHHGLIASEKKLGADLLAKMRAKQEKGEDAHNEVEAWEACEGKIVALESTMPPNEQVMVEDVTPEALTLCIERAGGAVALWTDEGGDVFQTWAGKYDKNPSLNVYLKGYDGGELRRHRVKDNTDATIPRACLTVGILTQPSTLQILTQSAAIGGRGLPARYLFSMPPSLVGHRLNTDPKPVTAEAMDAYREIITRLLNAKEAKDNTGVHRLTLSPEARAVYNAMYLDVEHRIKPGADLGDEGIMTAWGSKLCGNVVRIAAMLQLANSPKRGDDNAARWCVIEEDCMRRAVDMIPYLVNHMRRAFGIMDADPLVGRADRLLKWIRGSVPTLAAKPSYARREHGCLIFSGSEALDGIAKGGTMERDVSPALKALVDRNYIQRVQPVKRPKGRPPELYAVNPQVYADPPK